MRTSGTDSLNEHMDNFRVHVIAHNRETFDLAMRLAFGSHDRAEAWGVVDGWITLYWHADKVPPNGGNLPTKMRHDLAAPFVWQWLQEADAGRAPDIDGSVSRGFEIETTGGGWSYAIVRARVVWAMHGK